MNDNDGAELLGYLAGDSAEGKGNVNIGGGFAQEVQGSGFGFLDGACDKSADAVIGQAFEG